MRARRHDGDVTAGEGRYGNGYTRADGYVETRRTGHLLARFNGHVMMHRVVLFEVIGLGPHQCHWCLAPVNWTHGLMAGALVVDHVDRDRSNNDPSNLVPSCNHCNTARQEGEG